MQLGLYEDGYRLYNDGYQLKENEYLLKTQMPYRGTTLTGFITKFNKDGSIPVAFKDWGKNYPVYETPETYILEEVYRSGWRLFSWRFGQSQNWAALIHPNGFTLEIYLQQFLEIVENNTIVNGEIMGNFKWENRKLIKQTI